MVAKFQPAKFAAFENHIATGPADAAFIPGAVSLILYGDPRAPVLGLDRIRPEHRPPVLTSYLSFRIMVGLGMFFVALTAYGSYLRIRGTLFDKRWLLWIFVFSVAGAVAANELGWTAAEVGRQPWTVHPNVIRDASGAPAFDADGFVQYRLEEGLLTQNSISESVGQTEVIGSLIMFGVIYGLLFVIWVFVLNDKIQKGPVPVQITGQTTTARLLDAAAGRTLHEESMSEAKDREQ
jgi:cytochrome d ubiquinol oxidase subunit I